MAARWRVLLAHDARAATCDGLYDALESALGDVDIIDVASVEAARAALHAGARARIDLSLICLDLQPAPLGGVRLAQSIVGGDLGHVGRRGPPLVLVTRSQRWLPAHASELRCVPWVPPDVDSTLLGEAIAAAMAGPLGGARSDHGRLVPVGDDDWEPSVKVPARR